MPKYMVTIQYKVGVSAEDEGDAEIEAWKTIDTYAMEPRITVEEEEE